LGRSANPAKQQLTAEKPAALRSSPRGGVERHQQVFVFKGVSGGVQVIIRKIVADAVMNNFAAVIQSTKVELQQQQKRKKKRRRGVPCTVTGRDCSAKAMREELLQMDRRDAQKADDEKDRAARREKKAQDRARKLVEKEAEAAKKSAEALQAAEGIMAAATSRKKKKQQLTAIHYSALLKKAALVYQRPGKNGPKLMLRKDLEAAWWATNPAGGHQRPPSDASAALQKWVQCDLCNKWRRCPKAWSIPEAWDCTKNGWSAEVGSCEVAEEQLQDDDEENKNDDESDEMEEEEEEDGEMEVDPKHGSGDGDEEDDPMAEADSDDEEGVSRADVAAAMAGEAGSDDSDQSSSDDEQDRGC